MKKTNRYVYGCIAGMLLVFSGCTADDADGGMLPEGTPLQVLAGISGTDVATRADASNAYDRSAFIVGDNIRITRNKGGNTTTADYQLQSNGTSWSVAGGGTAFTFESAVTYSAVYPKDYTAIRADQRTAEAFRLSNRLVTPVNVKANSITGELAFTGTDKFTHLNSRITLTLTGNTNVTFAPANTSLNLKGAGLSNSSSSSEETVYPYRPDAGANSWCAILSPLTSGSKTITVTMTIKGTDGFDITYRCEVTCACLKDTQYKYSLTVENDKLVVSGVSIEAWHNADNSYVGGFDI